MYKGNVMLVVRRLLAAELPSVACLLFHLLCLVKYRNVVEETVEGLAKGAGISVPTATDGLKQLEELRVVRRPMRGKLELNPYLAWMGGDRDREKEMASWAGELAWLNPAGRTRGVPHEELGKVVELATRGG